MLPSRNIVAVLAWTMLIGAVCSDVQAGFSIADGVCQVPALASAGAKQLNNEEVAKRLGLRDADISLLGKIADERDDLFFVRIPYHGSLVYHFREGYLPKPLNVKLKTARGGNHDGLVTIPVGREETWNEWDRKEVRKLRESGFIFNEEGVLLSPPDHNGKRYAYYSDIDIHGIYRFDRNKFVLVDTNGPEFSDLFKALVATNLTDLVQHGANDNFVSIDSATGQRRMGRMPDPNEDYLFFDQRAGFWHIPSTAVLKKTYELYQIEWPYIEVTPQINPSSSKR